MARITRKHQKIFAGSASNNGVFGSAQAGTKVLSNDLDDIQSLAAFPAGWNSATISSQKLPTLEEMQALHYLTTSQLAYLFQEGIPEYLSTTTYYENSIVRKSGTYELYGSLTDDNIGNALPSQTDDSNWQYLGDLAEIKNIGESGKIIYGHAYASTGSFISTTTVVPHDDTIWQNTEGAEALTLSYTPQSATSKLIIECQAMLGSSSNHPFVGIGLFKNTDVDALAVSASNTPSASTYKVSASILYEMVSGTTSPITFKMRFGSNAGTAYLNGDSSGRIQGGVANTAIKITEIEA